MGRGWCFTLHSTSAVFIFAPRLIFFSHLGRFGFRTRACAPPPSLGHGRLLASSGALLHSSMCVAAMQRARISQWPCPSSSCFHTVTPPSDAQSVHLCAGSSRLFQPCHCRLAPRPRVSHCARVLRVSAPVVAAWRGVYLLRLVSASPAVAVRAHKPPLTPDETRSRIRLSIIGLWPAVLRGSSFLYVNVFFCRSSTFLFLPAVVVVVSGWCVLASLG